MAETGFLFAELKSSLEVSNMVLWDAFAENKKKRSRRERKSRAGAGEHNKMSGKYHQNLLQQQLSEIE
ncbi:hypothetical protein IFM47457_05603 [Aspergillus lentulus]|nr:hypothetical protein IFM47457_05603 [Aspergillus lentulus]